LPGCFWKPPPIPVAKAGEDVNFWLSPARLAVNHGFQPHHLPEIAGIIEANEPWILKMNIRWLRL